MKEGNKPESLMIDNIRYVREDSVGPPAGNRAVIVVDRGWIFAGDVTRENGRIKLTRAVWVFRWTELGFDGVIATPKDKRVTLRKMTNPIDIPEDAELFSVPVSADWGL
jgi:hypothetical protein